MKYDAEFVEKYFSETQTIFEKIDRKLILKVTEGLQEIRQRGGLQVK